jgi:hypothetical protein
MPEPATDLSGETGVLLILRAALPSIIQLRNPQVAFDGLFPVDAGWGKEFFPLGAGKHDVSCHVQLLKGLNTGKGHLEFEVPKATVITLRWTAPILASGRGWWKNLGPYEGGSRK